VTDPLRPTAADLKRWAYEDDADGKAIARAAEPDIDPDRD
jgi:hypothetical protein